MDAIPHRSTASTSRTHRGRQIPWLAVVRFHKDIVARAEQGFFSLNGRDDQADRWTSITDFSPVDLAGPWTIASEAIRSRPFHLTQEQGQHESVFLGGPCFLGWIRSGQDSWLPQWRPLLYREVALRDDGDHVEIVPKQGGWSLTPLLYGLLDRLEISIGSSLDDFAAALIETAANFADGTAEALDRRIFRALFSKAPGAEKEFNKAFRPDTFRVRPTPWVLFAPTSSFSALTRYLMRDYEHLEALLAADESNAGGLHILEDQAAAEISEDTEVLPLVPLNPSQRRAVQRILERRPLTVISGPPGTGKSQVVVSLLLNAWAQGQTVLFASNNNKAVDVVRERVERFESEFPLAVRAGAKQRQNIQEVLRRTLNMASASDDRPANGQALEESLLRRKKLSEQRTRYLEALDSQLPQRIDESRRTALRAYGEYRTTLAGVDDEEAALLAEQADLGVGGQAIGQIEDALEATRNWLRSSDSHRELVRADDQKRDDLKKRVGHLENSRNRAVEEVGLPAAEGGDWRWLVSGPSAELIADWQSRFRDLLDTPIEQALEPIAWQADFSRWQSAEQADAWADQARTFAASVRHTCADLSAKIVDIRKLSEAVEEGRRALAELGLAEHAALPGDALREWAASYAELTTREPGRLDFVPWSHHGRLRRRLERLEHQIRPTLPLAVLTRVGTLNDEGRLRLAPIIEAARHWLELRQQWTGAQPVIDEVDSRLRHLQSQATALKLQAIPAGQDLQGWLQLGSHAEDAAIVADHARQAWQRRSQREAVENALRAIAKEWTRLASGVPIREAWRQGQGQGFDAAVRALAEQPNEATVAKARAALYAGRLSRLIECWERAADHQQAADQVRDEILAVPHSSFRLASWWRERPARALVLRSEPDDWPDTDEAAATLDQLADWCSRWNAFSNEVRPARQKQAASELGWAVDKLKQAVSILPVGTERQTLTGLVDDIRQMPTKDWPIADLNQAFSAFSPERLRARIERLEADLERGAFEDAKARWLERLRADDEAIRAVDALEKSLRLNRGEVVDSMYDAFRAALRAVPIWITTAQASQAIPLLPELFDIVVIDEASQCTLTNLLPLMYRGRTLAVIGDENQLPAIPTIQEAEELALARKHQIEEHLSLIGHATNDVYGTATESLPRRRADVIMLEEHFRSHPQIIGFSNRYIYLQRLELKKDPSWGQHLPIGSGVHSVPVTGVAARGSNGRSWVNVPEAETVLRLIQDLKRGDSRSLSLGVVTPFAAQKEWLRERIDGLGLASEVLVDTASGFQGDERDVMLFSPVVARGISAAASRWVEVPPNLINVAVTRAREALFVVADFDYCLQQDGLLRRLASYCRDVQLLRDTSPAELELFSWMVVKGWEPKVHPRIGDVEVDFVLDVRGGERLAIEVDGRRHHEETPERDKARDAYLLALGHDVMRIPAREVLETPFEVVHQIESRLAEG